MNVNYFLFYRFNTKRDRPLVDSKSWDLLIFTQSWPKSVCYTWKAHNASHSCYYPSQKNLWTIHGIWFVPIVLYFWLSTYHLLDVVVKMYVYTMSLKIVVYTLLCYN